MVGKRVASTVDRKAVPKAVPKVDLSADQMVGYLAAPMADYLVGLKAGLTAA